jgi:hypothetical protein
MEILGGAHDLDNDFRGKVGEVCHGDIVGVMRLDGTAAWEALRVLLLYSWYCLRLREGGIYLCEVCQFHIVTYITSL